MYRVEDKFNCSEQELLYLQTRLETVLRKDYNQKYEKGYTITSVYFDDYFDSHLNDTAEGYRFREKYRIRIYNSSYSVIKLEVKYKKDNKVLKKSRNISIRQMISLMRSIPIEDDAPSIDNTITLFNLAIMKRGLRPVIIVEYERQAYIFDAGNVRITIDRNLRYSKDVYLFMQQLPFQSSLVEKPDSVLEVKYDDFLPGFIAGILETGNMCQSTYSKYRLCREGADLCQQKM